mgnify:CR=1 FL=1
MKIKTTRKHILETCDHIRSAGYCTLQNLLREKEPVYYTSGQCGWNFDVYQVNGLTICTGYRSMPGKRLTNTKEYDDKALEIWSNYDLAYSEQRKMVDDLLYEFCKLNGGIDYEMEDDTK